MYRIVNKLGVFVFAMTGITKGRWMFASYDREKMRLTNVMGLRSRS